MRIRRRGLLIVSCAVLCGCGGSTRSPQPPPAQPEQTQLLPDQTIVEGTVTAAHIVDAVAPPLSLPVVITVPARGHGGAHIQTASENTRGESIDWDAGQPLPLSGTGAIDLGPVTVDADGGGLTWHLDGGVRVLTAGRYVAGSSVAVGSSGLARPEDQAPFTVAAQGALTTGGDAQIRSSTAALTLNGPGNMTLTGSLTVRTAGATRAVHEVIFRGGPFKLHLRPVPGGLVVNALLQGPVTLQ